MSISQVKLEIQHKCIQQAMDNLSDEGQMAQLFIQNMHISISQLIICVTLNVLSKVYKTEYQGMVSYQQKDADIPSFVFHNLILEKCIFILLTTNCFPKGTSAKYKSSASCTGGTSLVCPTENNLRCHPACIIQSRILQKCRQRKHIQALNDTHVLNSGIVIE